VRQFLIAAVLVLMTTSAPAVEVPFRDGSVIEAVNYTVTGSYLMLEMDDGSKVAYDVADIDLDALRRAEAEAAAATGTVTEAAEEKATLGAMGALRTPEEIGSDTGGLAITDQHVRHVSGSGIEGPEDEAEGEDEAGEGTPEGFEEGGRVLLNNITVTPTEGGDWVVRGEVINRASDVALDVRANLQAAMPDGEPWSASVPVSGALGPDEKATFTHTFATPQGAEEGWSPQVQAAVVWMKSETRLEPKYNRTAPHPSALPLDRGGVGGADVRPTPSED
jgi:hypothetical protein